MKICDIKTIDIIPRFMQEDRTVRGLCAAMDYLINLICSKLPLVNLYENLEMLEDEDLDYINEKDRIPWYDTSYTKEQKIRIISNYEKNCMFLGTKQAIEGVIEDIFGMGKEEEWYEYGSKAFYFKIITSALLTENTDKLVSKIVKNVKTSKSKLEYVQVQRDISHTLFAGVHAYAVSKPEDIEEKLVLGAESIVNKSFTAIGKVDVSVGNINECLLEENELKQAINSAQAESSITYNTIKEV